jgi:hypothetical protein
MIGVPLPEGHKLNLLNLRDLLSRIPRPDRSGWLSVISWTLFALFALAPMGGSGKPSLLCTLVPWACPYYGDGDGDDGASNGRHVEYVTFYPGASHSKGKRPCTCHWDFLNASTGEISHWHSSMEVTCATSNFLIDYKGWSPSFHWECDSSGHCTPNTDKLGEFRWHCTDDDSKEE